MDGEGIVERGEEGLAVAREENQGVDTGELADSLIDIPEMAGG